MFKKIIYIYVTVIIGIIVYSISNYIATGNEIIRSYKEVAKEAISKENYDDIARLFTPFIDTNEAYVYGNDKVTMVVYFSGTIKSNDITENETEHKDVRTYEKAISVYIINKDDSQVNVGESKPGNQAGINISTENNSLKSLFYPFNEDKSVITEVDGVKQVSEVDIIYINTIVNCFYTDFLIDDFNNEAIKSIEFIDADGEVVLSSQDGISIQADMNSNFYQKYTAFSDEHNAVVTDFSRNISEERTAETIYNEFIDLVESDLQIARAHKINGDQNKIRMNTFIPIGIYGAIVILIGYLFIFRKKRNSLVESAKITAKKYNKEQNNQVKKNNVIDAEVVSDKNNNEKDRK